MTPFATKDLLVTSIQDGLAGDACDPTETCTNNRDSECRDGEQCGTHQVSVMRQHQAAFDALMRELD